MEARSLFSARSPCLGAQDPAPGASVAEAFATSGETRASPSARLGAGEALGLGLLEVWGLAALALDSGAPLVDGVVLASLSALLEGFRRSPSIRAC